MFQRLDGLGGRRDLQGPGDPEQKRLLQVAGVQQCLVRKDGFRRAVRHQLPVSLHLREAFADAWPILDNFSPLTGVVHCFTGSKRDLKNALDRGLYIGVGGLATYTTNPLPPLDRLLLETDAPFLTPEPFRGKINSPRYIKTIAMYLAAQLGVDFSTLEEQTTQNARNLFNF